MSDQKEIKEIRTLIESSEYDRAFRLCNAVSQKKRKSNPLFCYHGALSLFGLGHIRQAEGWVDEFEKHSPHSVLSLYLRAYQELHRDKMDRALLCYTRILEIDPSDTFADSLIERLRRGEKSVQREIEIPENFKNYFPGFREDEKSPLPQTNRGPDRFGILVWFFMAAGAILLGIFIFFIPPLFHDNPFKEYGEKLPETPSFGTVIPEKEFVDDKPRFLYKNSKDALMDYAAARGMILEGNVNSALRKIGRIELSNAGFEIKERASLLREFIPIVNPEGFQDSVSVEEIKAEPFILRGAQVIWNGYVESVQNMGKANQRIIFSQKKSGEPPFVVFDIVNEGKEVVKKGERITIFGIYEKILSDELIQIKTLQILNRSR